MIDSNGVAVLDSIQDLKEGMLGAVIIANELALLGDIGEQITFRTELDDHECTVGTVQDANQRDHIGVLAGLVMESNFPTLESLLALVQSRLGQSLDSVGNLGVKINGLVDHTVGADAQD